jgi:cell shape-determining protein MreD
MAIITIIFGFLFTALGLAGRFLTHTHSNTALIPAGFGVAFIILGYLAQNEKLRKMLMHITSLISLIGFVMTAKALWTAHYFLLGQTVLRPAAVLSRATMAILCLVYFGLCFKSFVDARVKKGKKK